MLPVLAIVVAMLAALAAARRRRSIVASPSPAAPDLLRRLRALKAEGRLEALRTSILPAGDTWEGRLALGVSRAPDDRERVDLASEAVAVLEESYSAGAAWGASAVRIVLLVGLLLGTVGIAQGNHVQAVAAFVVAALGASVTHGLVSSTAILERRQREIADALVQVLVLGDEPPRRRGRRS